MPLPNIDPLGLTPLDEATRNVWGPAVEDRIDKNSARSNDHENRIATIEATLASIGTGFTAEQAQDAVAALIAAGSHSGITITYDDLNNKLSFVVTPQFIKSATAPTSPSINDLWVDLS